MLESFGIGGGDGFFFGEALPFRLFGGEGFGDEMGEGGGEGGAEEGGAEGGAEGEHCDVLVGNNSDDRDRDRMRRVFVGVFVWAGMRRRRNVEELGRRRSSRDGVAEGLRLFSLRLAPLFQRE